MEGSRWSWMELVGMCVYIDCEWMDGEWTVNGRYGIYGMVWYGMFV